MRWVKKGLVYCPDGSLWWARSHAYVPTPVIVDDDTLRIYVSCLDAEGRGRIGYVDVSAADPRRILQVTPEPVLDIGRPGTFDENGVMATCVLDAGDGRTFLYYVGFELGRKIRYRLLTGLAVSRDGGRSFERVRQVPILERSDAELYFRGGPFVMREGGLFRMWYVAGSEWLELDGKPMPVYELRYQESGDGIGWGDRGRTVLPIEQADEHGFGRPYVVRAAGGYQLHYSVRRRALRAYRLGFAESSDGVRWTRNDAALGLDVSASGWDAEVVCYSAVVTTRFGTYLFYNGNGMGATGFGYARLEP